MWIIPQGYNFQGYIEEQKIILALPGYKNIFLVFVIYV